jgi:gamma-glutamyltranspeptidase/glutathione hydrolase
MAMTGLRIIAGLAGVLALTGPVAAQLSAYAPVPANQPIISDWARVQPVVAPHGMVASQEAQATRIGVDILKRGGNAVDAAVAVGFALAVTLPRAGNIGGGGFMLVHLAGQQKTIAIDYRETAPAAATRTMFLDDKGEADPKKSRDSGLAIGVPGTVAGLATAHRDYGSGRLTLAQLMEPAITLARRGLTVDDDLADNLPTAQKRLGAWPSSAKIFLRPDGTPWRRGDLLLQTDLAQTLEGIARNGPAAFYTGPVAEKIVAAVRGAGGGMTLDDLKSYKAVIREPVTGSYRGYQIASMPPPSSGGVHVIEILNTLEGYPLGALGQNSAETIHLMAEAMKPAYADRSEYLGDPDFLKVPVTALTSKRYAESLRQAISATTARAARDIKPGVLAPYESDQTTHFSVVDAEGNAVANTYTLNFSYGVGLVAEGTGVLLNNELDDFAAKPGAPNGFGLLGGDANAPGPNKRPLSSMSPTFVFKDGRLVLATGSPGGSRIITTVVQIISNVIDHGMTIAEATEAPRVHHQWFPDELRVERGLSIDTIRILESKGHKVSVQPAMGSTQSIQLTPQGLAAAADQRQRGTLASGY